MGCFPGAARPYDAQDLSGNVWEWCQSLYQPYPYGRVDGREDPEAKGARVVRGGAFLNYQWYVRCAVRYWNNPDLWDFSLGFRVCVSA